MKEKTAIKQITEKLAAADNRLHEIHAQMKLPNVIRTMIEDNKTMDEINIYVKSVIQIGVRMKSDVIKEIEICHLELSKRHMKLRMHWQFGVNNKIGEKSK